MIVERICTKCNRVYADPEKYFYKQSTGPEGLTVWCKSCTDRYQETNDLRVKSYRRKYKKEVAEYLRQHPDAPRSPQRTTATVEKEYNKSKGLKRCTRCLKLHPATAEFFPRNNGGLAPHCHECNRKMVKEARERKKIR